MKWVKVKTIIEREDWVEIGENDNAKAAEEHIETLIQQDPRFEFIRDTTTNPPTTSKPSMQLCQQLGIGVHPL
jgi:hypothetical protein